jgi:hypothetical protein
MFRVTVARSLHNTCSKGESNIEKNADRSVLHIKSKALTE